MVVMDSILCSMNEWMESSDGGDGGGGCGVQMKSTNVEAWIPVRSEDPLRSLQKL